MTAGVGVESAVADELGRYLDEVGPALRKEHGRSRGYPARLAWQKALHAGGWAAPEWPAEHGGRGISVRDRVACSLLLGDAGVPPQAGILGLQNVAYALMTFGSEEQKASLPKILSAEEIWCQGFSEPEAGSDLASLRTKAEPVDGGYVVNGQKIWTSEGMYATHMLLLARTDPSASKHKGISAFAIEMDTPGIERRPIKQITGESDFAEVFFTDVRIPASSLLGPLNGGWKVTTTTLAFERAGVIGMAAQLENDVRRSMVGALGSGGVAGNSPRTVLARRRIAQCFADARVAGLLGMKALAEAERGAAPGAQQSLIKLGWAITTQEVAETLFDLDPGQGRYCEAANELLQSRATSIAGGTTEILKSLAGERALGLAREPRS